MKSGNLNFLEPSELLQACNGTALSLFVQNYLLDESTFKTYVTKNANTDASF